MSKLSYYDPVTRAFVDLDCEGAFLERLAALAEMEYEYQLHVARVEAEAEAQEALDRLAEWDARMERNDVVRIPGLRRVRYDERFVSEERCRRVP